MKFLGIVSYYSVNPHSSFMDSFFAFFSLSSTETEDPADSLPTNEEEGGGGNPAHCIIA